MEKKQFKVHQWRTGVRDETFEDSRTKYIAEYIGNYVILDTSKIPELGDTFKEEIEEDKNSFRIKPSKNIAAFIRRKNLNHLKEQPQNQIVEQAYGIQKRSPRRVISPIQRMNMSC